MSLLAAARRLARTSLPEPLAYAARGRALGLTALVGDRYGLGRRATWELFGDLQRVADHVPCGHGEPEILEVIQAILTTPVHVPGMVVEAGCWKGGSTCKLSLAAARVGRPLRVYDSFEGIPDHDEGSTPNLGGHEVTFTPGTYAGSLEEVRGHVDRFGRLAGTEFVPGWFEDTLPGHREPVAVAYLDVDLVSSTLTCLEHLWPHLSPGGVIFSQDGHLQNVLDALADDHWWMTRFGHRAPPVTGAGHKKLVSIRR